MKELTKYSRLAGFLEKLYDKLNTDFFDGVLERPVITIQSSSRSYGHYTLYDAWSVKGEGYKEINIAAGTLNRPIEYTVCTLLHEMCHQYNNEIINIQDCSRGGTYHNKHFKQAAEAHGLTVTRTEQYGWSMTTPSDELLTWILDNGIKVDLYGVSRLCLCEVFSRFYPEQLRTQQKLLHTLCGTPHHTIATWIKQPLRRYM